jgi:hypothetical protein
MWVGSWCLTDALLMHVVEWEFIMCQWLYRPCR